MNIHHSVLNIHELNASRQTKSRLFHQLILNRDSWLRKTVRAFVPNPVIRLLNRKQAGQKLLDKNKGKKAKYDISDVEHKIYTDYFKVTYDYLLKNLDINFQESNESFDLRTK